MQKVFLFTSTTEKETRENSFMDIDCLIKGKLGIIYRPAIKLTNLKQPPTSYCPPTSTKSQEQNYNAVNGSRLLMAAVGFISC